MTQPTREQCEELASHLYAHSHFHDSESNPTAYLMRKGAEYIRALAFAAGTASRPVPTYVHYVECAAAIRRGEG